MTELLKQRRTKEAFKARESLTENFKSMSKIMEEFEAADDDEKNRAEYTKEKVNTMYRRSSLATDQFSEDGITEDELYLFSSFSGSSNSKYKRSHRDL